MRKAVTGFGLAALWITCALAQAPQRDVPHTAAVSGVVKDALTGQALGGAVVTMRTTSAAPLAVTRHRLTDEYGRFVFRDLAPDDRVRISATRFGYVDGEYGQRSVLAPGGLIALGAGEWFGEADVLLWKPGAISGRVVDEFGDPMVGVYVRALARQQVAGRSMHLAGPVDMTDDRGVYRIAGLPPGTFVVQVPSVQASVFVGALAGGYDFARAGSRGLRLRGLPATPSVDAALQVDGPSRMVVGTYPAPPVVDGVLLAYPMTFHPGVMRAGEAQTIDVGPGEQRQGVDIAMRPVPTARVSGSVNGPADALAGLVLRLMPAGLEDLGSGAEAATTLVAPDGRFAFLNVPAGDYVINGPRILAELTFDTGDAPSLPQAPGMALTSSRSGSIPGTPGVGLVRRASVSDETFWFRQPVAVGSDDVTDLVVEARPGRTLAGTFVYDGSTRVVAVRQPAGVVGAAPAAALGSVTTRMPRPDRPPTVELEPADGLTRLGLPRSNPLRQDMAEEAFEVNGLQDGAYVMRVPSYDDRFSVKLIAIDGVDYTHRPIDITTLGPQPDVRVVLTDQVNVVTGVIRNSAGPTLEGGVIAFPVERDQWSRYGFNPVRIRTATMAGVSGYVLRGLPAGEYFVAAVDRSRITAWQDPAFLEQLASRAVRLTLTWGETRTVDLDLTREP